MLQESVYAKLALNSTAVEAIVSNIRKNKPAKGLIQILTITEKQYSRMEFILGEKKTDIVNNDGRIVLL